MSNDARLAKIIYNRELLPGETLAELEHRVSIEKNYKTIQAYERDVSGSYERAKTDAKYTAGLRSAGNRADLDFIERTRKLSYDAINNKLKKEQRELNKKFDTRNVRMNDLGTFLDVPVRISDALGRDIGEKLAKLDNKVRDRLESINFLDKDSSLSKGIDYANTGLDYANVALDDVSKIITESPYLLKQKTKEALRNITNKLPFQDFFKNLDKGFSLSLKDILGDFADILNEWWHDPRTLCCFIKIMTAISLKVASNVQNKEVKFSQEIKDIFAGKTTISEVTGTREFFDKMISILKIMREFLKQEFGFHLALNLDLGLSMMKASSAGLMTFLASLQQILEDEIYYKLMKWIEESVDEQTRQCIPFEKLLRLIADIVTGPDGIFQYIQQYIDAHMLGFADNMRYGYNKAKKMKALDITSLNKLIALIEQLRDALLNLELCIEADFSKTPSPGDDGSKMERNTGIRKRDFADTLNKFASDGIIYPTDREIRSFITNRIGETAEFADQVLTYAKQGSDQNTGIGAGSSGGSVNDLINTIGDCSKTLSPTRLNELAKIMTEWGI